MPTDQDPEGQDLELGMSPLSDSTSVKFKLKPDPEQRGGGGSIRAARLWLAQPVPPGNARPDVIAEEIANV